ncbi:hypothetical protein GCM10009347_26720 [Shewanella algicola]|uniref:Uncharacterized protein n=1 Tax=Shewanella algicola TaxID=640633 RepID=A0A9X1ZD20_9GAMM|nr:hypothetical protein [Shewanella algicola]MCL1106355.1 hypothetical protein [Shewanella algicola]GGP58973.1 hypothetical protein GCM10009347_26720 [Shewanella algicola]
MKMNSIRNPLILFSLTVIGFLIGIWLAPHEPITSFLPTQSESEDFKQAVNTIALVSGVSTSIFAFVAGYFISAPNVQVIASVVIVGLLYISLDFIRFGQLTTSNLIWLSIFVLGMLLIWGLERLSVLYFKRNLKR